MRLCDSLVFDPDHEDNRCPAGPWRIPNPNYCFRCGGRVGHGRLLDPATVKALTGEAASLLKQLADDYPYAYDLAHHPTRRPQNGRSGLVGDPTGNHVADPRRARIHTYTLIVARLVEDAVRNLRHADDAAGSALWTAEPAGPADDHVKAPFHDGTPRLVGRSDLTEAYEAQDRRRQRGEL